MSILKKLWCRTYQTAFRMVIPILPYRQPELHDSLDSMADIVRSRGISRILIVTDQGLVRAGICRMVQEKLEAAGIAYAIYDGTAQETATVAYGTGSASLSGITLTGGAPGTVTVIATKEGTSQYNPARSQPLVITIE